MKKIIGSKTVTVAALVVGFFAAVAFLSDTSSAYHYYMSLGISLWRVSDTAIVPLLTIIVCLAIFVVSILKSAGRTAIDSAPAIPAARQGSPESGWRNNKYPWQRVDWLLLVVLVYCFVSAIVFLWWLYPARIIDYGFSTSTQILFWSVAVYVAAMAMLAEILARARDGQLIKTLYWVEFFRLYPIKKAAGLFMALLLAGSLIALFIIYPYEAINGRINSMLLAGRAFVLVALTYLCSFLLSLSAKYEKANEEKVLAERFKAELITNVSHDIRTPLTSIINYIDLLHTLRIEDGEFAKYLGVLDKKSARLKVLIDDLMDAAKAGTGNISVDIREINLAEIVGQVAGDFDDQFAERELALVLRQPEDPVFAQADSGHLCRALENLFSNAAKYALPGTRVFAEISLTDGHPAFSLKNTSETPIDIPAEELIEQFIRGDRARGTEGSGLGLYIAKSLVELMAATFTLRASGDLFEATITFPP